MPPRLSFSPGFRGLNSDPHACTVHTLPTKTSVYPERTCFPEVEDKHTEPYILNGILHTKKPALVSCPSHLFCSSHCLLLIFEMAAYYDLRLKGGGVVCQCMQGTSSSTAPGSGRRRGRGQSTEAVGMGVLEATAAAMAAATVGEAGEGRHGWWRKQ